MTYKEAIEILDVMGGTCSNKEEYIVAHMAIELFEKQIPKKPSRYITEFPSCCEISRCPNCEQAFGFEEGYNYCFNCGQRIDWE